MYTSEGLKIAEATALIDCGAEGKFVDKSIVDPRKKKKLKKPITVRNVDGTANKEGRITHKVQISYKIEGVKMKDWFYVTALGDQQLIFGIPWLQQYNPLINWRKMTLSFDETKAKLVQETIERLEQRIEEKNLDKEKDLVISFIKGEDVWV